MTKYLIPAAAIAAVLVSAPAAAEDSPFAGFYIGVNAGVVWGDSTGSATLSTTSSTPVVTPPIVGAVIPTINANASFDSNHHTGFTGGLEAGYNYVSDGGLLLGVETDIDIYDMTGAGARSVTSGATTYTVAHSVDTNWLWTLRPRVGYAGGDFAVFATGGLAIADFKHEASFTDSSTVGDNVLFKKNKTKTGWTVGAGAAYAFSPNISLKGEYLFENYGHDDVSTLSTNGFYSLDASAHLKSHLFRAGLDYRF